MSKTNAFAAAATLILAGLPALAVATGAQAAPAVIRVADLNLASPTGQRVFAERTAVAAQKVCRNVGDSRIPSADCRAAVRTEAMEKAAALTPSMMAAR